MNCVDGQQARWSVGCVRCSYCCIPSVVVIDSTTSITYISRCCRFAVGVSHLPVTCSFVVTLYRAVFTQSVYGYSATKWFHHSSSVAAANEIDCVHQPIRTLHASLFCCRGVKRYADVEIGQFLPFDRPSKRSNAKHHLVFGFEIVQTES